METNVERLDDDRIHLTVTVPPDVVGRIVDEEYKRLSRDMEVDGFRKGKVPRRVVENLLGSERVLEAMREAVVAETYPQAIDQAGLRPIDEPEMGETAAVVEGEGYSYDAKVSVRPELTLSSYEGITVTVPPARADDADIEGHIRQLRDGLATLEVVDDRGLGPDDFALISFTGLVDGEPYEGNTVDKYLYEFGAGLMPEPFEEQLRGAETGQDVEVSFTLDDPGEDPDTAGKTYTFDVHVHEVKQKILPELGPEFACDVGGFESMAELRQATRERLDRAMAMMHMQAISVKAQEALAARLEGDIPKPMVDQRVKELVKDFYNHLDSEGVTPAEYSSRAGVALDSLEDDFQPGAESSVRVELALEALFRALELEVADEDIDVELGMYAVDQEAKDEMRKQFEAMGGMAALEEQAARRKAAKWLMDNVTVVEERPEDAGGEDKGSEASEEE